MNPPEHIGPSMGASAALIDNFNMKPESSQCPVIPALVVNRDVLEILKFERGFVLT